MIKLFKRIMKRRREVKYLDAINIILDECTEVYSKDYGTKEIGEVVEKALQIEKNAMFIYNKYVKKD